MEIFCVKNVMRVDWQPIFVRLVDTISANTALPITKKHNTQSASGKQSQYCTYLGKTVNWEDFASKSVN